MTPIKTRRKKQHSVKTLTPLNFDRARVIASQAYFVRNPGFPNARIVFDRFHVMKAVNDELNHLRIRLGITRRRSRDLLCSNAEDLTQESQAELESMLAQSPCLRIAHELKEELRLIYETSGTFRQSKSKITKWLRSARLFYHSACQMIQKHLEGICNYFINRTTSGTMEGINNKIKLIMRQAYGFSNFKHMRSRLIAAFEQK